MSLTTAQLAALKSAIQNEVDPTFVALRNASNDPAMADWFNQDHASTMIWKPDVPVIDAIGRVVWSEFEAATQAKRDSWFALTQAPSIDATQATVRAGFSGIFGGASATLTALSALAQRKATRFENVFTVANVCSLFGAVARDVDMLQARTS